MNILLLGSGGREHAFAWKIKQSPRCKKLFIAPGNAGTLQCGTNVPINPSDFPSIKDFVLKEKISMVVVGPEDPLVKGIHDYFLGNPEIASIPVIGPQKDGAQLEGSKDFSKKFMEKYHIPTARYQTFNKTTLKKGIKFLETLRPPFVLKADGLAAGKGVIIPHTIEEAKKELKEMLCGKFGSASSKVVIEEFLPGIELSVFVLSDGKSYKILPSAKDYKRIGDGDTGLNTGGMGAVSPVPFADKTFLKKVENQIIIPTIEGLKKEGIVYKGFIFIGLMAVPSHPSPSKNGAEKKKSKSGNFYTPYVIEYNCRMGDPETEVVIPRIKSDIVDVFCAMANQTLQKSIVKIDKRTATTVMLSSGGYPGDYKKGIPVYFLNKKGRKDLSELQNKEDESTIYFHAGTGLNKNFKKGNQTITTGGRVLAVTSFGENISEAAGQSYENIKKIKFNGMYFRKDIGKDLMKINKANGKRD